MHEVRRLLRLARSKPATAKLELRGSHLKLLLAFVVGQGERLGLGLHERRLSTLLDLPVELRRLRLPALGRRWCPTGRTASILALHLHLLLRLLLAVPVAQRAVLLLLAHLLLRPRLLLVLLLGRALEPVASLFRSQPFRLRSAKLLGVQETTGAGRSVGLIVARLGDHLMAWLRHVLLVLEAVLLHVDFTILLILRVLLREGDKGCRGALAGIARVLQLLFHHLVRHGAAFLAPRLLLMLGLHLVLLLLHAVQ